MRNSDRRNAAGGKNTYARSRARDRVVALVLRCLRVLRWRFVSCGIPSSVRVSATFVNQMTLHAEQNAQVVFEVVLGGVKKKVSVSYGQSVGEMW